MNILETVREQFQHMEWADALVWKTIRSAGEQGNDEKLRVWMNHIHLVQRAFFSIWTEQPFNPEIGAELRGEALAAWGRAYHRGVGPFLASVSESDLDRIIELPWAEFIAGRIGKKPQMPTLGETFFQVISHSAYHRGQVNARLRELQIEPPLVDFITWIWVGKPAAAWE